MNINEIMNLSPTNIAASQAEALEEHFKATMARVYEAFMRRDRATLQKLVDYSPAGDCMGSENYYIQFGWDKGKRVNHNEAPSIDNPKNLDIMDLFAIYENCCAQAGLKIPCELRTNDPAKTIEKGGTK